MRENGDQEDEQANREGGDQAVRRVADFDVSFLDQPAGAQQHKTETQAGTTQHRKRTEPAEVPAV